MMIITKINNKKRRKITMVCSITFETNDYKIEMTIKKWMFIKTYYCIDIVDKKTGEKYTDEIHNINELGNFTSFGDFLQKIKIEKTIPLIFDRYISHLLTLSGNTARRATQISENINSTITTNVATLSSKNKKDKELVKELQRKNNSLNKEIAKVKVNLNIATKKNNELSNDNIHLHKQNADLNKTIEGTNKTLELENMNGNGSSSSSNHKKRRHECN
jgi:hypothetical protein